MIKLTEIYEKPTEYDPALETNRQSYGLRNVFVNPSYIVYMLENEALKRKSARGALVEGMDSGLNYTEMRFMFPGQSTKVINVVGDVNLIAEACGALP